MIVLRNGILPGISINKGHHNHQRLQPLPMVNWYLLRECKEEENTCHQAAIRLQPLPTVSPEGAQDVKKQGYLPQIAEMHMRGMTSVNTDSCIFLHIKKALNSLIIDTLFPLINNNFLMFRLPALCCQTSV